MKLCIANQTANDSWLGLEIGGLGNSVGCLEAYGTRSQGQNMYVFMRVRPLKRQIIVLLLWADNLLQLNLFRINEDNPRR